MKLADYIGEATAYDKKLMLERKDPISWLKSVSAFANTQGGKLLYGVSDSGELICLENAEKDAEDISEAIKTQMDPIPQTNLSIHEEDGKRFVVVEIFAGEETPYYVRHKGSLTAYVRIGNESVKADPLELNRLVLKGSRRSWDSLPSVYKRKDFSFEVLYSLYHEKTLHSFEETDFQSVGLIADDGRLTNAGALLADESPIRQSRIFCTRWNGLDMTSGLGEAIDDVELEGCVIGQLQDAVSFVRNNSRKKWWKESDHREELPDYPERAVTEAIANAIIHRDYMQMGSEIHIDMYDDRMEIYSPGGMMDGRLIQQLNPLTVPSKRRNPLLADFFSRLGLMERRGSGMKKIIDSYKRFEKLPNFHAPEFQSNASEFHVILWNLNYENEVIGEITPNGTPLLQEFVKENGEVFVKEFVKGQSKFAKEFVKANRQIYKLISQNPHINAAQMAESMGVSARQVQKYLKRLQESGKITRVGGRKIGEWKIIDEEYEGFFDRI